MSRKLPGGPERLSLQPLGREHQNVSTVFEVDFTKIDKLRRQHKQAYAERGVKLTFMPFILNGSITTLTSLDFLGFGLPPGSPSLGELLAQGKANLQAPWLGITGFVVLATMLSLLIFIGEALRGAFDPRKLTP